MEYIRLEKISESWYEMYFAPNSKKIGKVIMDVDGYFSYWPEDMSGSFSSWTMRLIADKLEEMNKDWDDKVNEYFERERQENEEGI